MTSIDLWQIVRFGLVGVWNTGFDMVLYIVFYRLLRGRISSSATLKAETLAHIGAFLIANTVSYQLNSRFTFESSGPFLPYFLVSCLSLGLSALSINYLAKDKFFEGAQKIAQKRNLPSISRQRYAIGIKLATICIVMFVNYLGYKYLVFGG